jgi:hypothetical protein
MYKILSVPVKFGKSYMLAIDSDFPIECMCCIYGPKGYLKAQTELLNTHYNTNGNTYKKFQRMQFQHPIIYKTVDWHQLYSTDDSTIDAISNYDQGLG